MRKLTKQGGPVCRGLRGLLGAVVAALLVTGCAVEVQNTRPAKELERMSKPQGSVYLGWRVFQDKCASCHGPTANGTMGAPDLLPIVRAMGPRQFVGLVLTRYDWSLPVLPGNTERTAREAQVDTVLQRGEAPLVMPAWGSEPRVNAHILDLYAYISARAQGTQGPERPSP